MLREHTPHVNTQTNVRYAVSGVCCPQVEVMKGNVESRVQVYMQDLQKFRARWDQLKPSHDIIESGDHETLQRCVQNIRDRRAEFDELEKTREKLMCVNLLSSTQLCHHSKIDKTLFTETLFVSGKIVNTSV